MLGAVTLACTGSGPAPQRTAPGETDSYEEELARIPLEGIPPDWPLHWEVPEFPEPDQVAAAGVARLFEALEHMLIFGPVPREPEDLDLLLLLATDDYAEQVRGYHANVRGTNPDPWIGPRWIRVMEARVNGDAATVLLCADEGFHGPVSRGGGSEVWRDHRAVLTEYDLVRRTVDDDQRWLVDHTASYAGDDYRDPEVGYQPECDEWATHKLGDA
ncbi:hypothetical protein JQS43_19150 [Natronosporangium hydrolyticum]|uniref:Uncharacterized protein n=1 Tax=Natronosporangium hydrolyticum TaxID=2811111 RepID=A0A895Y7G5_9ACTN|nr:hypothetical protein [Natronosporangium hydrolyticum]QSB13674.1 hypothetical protein JQS43_19150 [Natronosporangium hydrolyticum]